MKRWTLACGLGLTLASLNAQDPLDVQAIKERATREAMERSKADMDRSKVEIERAREEVMRVKEEIAFLQGMPGMPLPPGAPPPPPGKDGKVYTSTWSWSFDGDNDSEGLYRAAKRHIDRREWDRAIVQLDRIVERKQPRADAALYWKAYALNKLGRRSEALSSLADLTKQHASSRWMNDARALEIEVKQTSGQPVSPDAEENEDLKLLALNGLMRTDPDRAFPALEKILGSNAAPRLKERALFVSAHHRSPRTRDLLIRFAKGGTNPDLQARAVEYLGHQNSPETQQALDEVYAGTGDPQIRRAVLRAYTSARAKDKLVAAARGEKALEVKREAIRGLGELDGEPELWQLLQSESAPEVRQEIVRALPSKSESADRMIEFAKTEKDPKVRAALVEYLGRGKTPRALDALVAMYGSEKEPEMRKRILRSVRRHDNAKALVDIARAEKDPKLRRVVVEELSEMKSKEATDYLMELLNK